MWTLDETTEDDGYYRVITLKDPSGRLVMSAKLCVLEEDANEFSVDRERLLTALNRGTDENNH